MKNKNSKGIYRFSSAMCLIVMSLNAAWAQTQSIEQEQLQKAQERQKTIQEQHPKPPKSNYKRQRAKRFKRSPSSKRLPS